MLAVLSPDTNPVAQKSLTQELMVSEVVIHSGSSLLTWKIHFIVETLINTSKMKRNQTLNSLSWRSKAKQGCVGFKRILDT